MCEVEPVCKDHQERWSLYTGGLYIEGYQHILEITYVLDIQCWSLRIGGLGVKVVFNTGSTMSYDC